MQRRFLPPIFAGIIGVALAAALPLAIAWQARLAREIERETARVLAERPVDLSVPAEHTLSFHLDSSSGFGLKVLVLDVPPADVPYDHAPLLTGLEGSAVLDRAPFDLPASVPLLASTSFSAGPDSRALARLPGSWPGDYTVRVTVSRGAPGLAGGPRRLAVMNDISGTELLGARVLVMASVAASAIGVALGWWAIARLRGLKARAR